MLTSTDIAKQEIKSLSRIDWIDCFSMATLIGGIIYSPFLFTVGLVCMVLRILFIGSWREKILALKHNYKPLLCLLSIYILNILGLLWSKDLGSGFFELNHKLPFLVLPLFALVICPPKKQSLHIVFFVYITLITIGILIGIVHYLVDPYADSRILVPTARNISFAFHICFAAAIMTIMASRNHRLRKFLIPLVVLFCVYLFIASLLSGLVTLFILVIVALIYILRKRNKIYSLLATLIVVFVVALGGYWVYNQYTNYFHPKQPFVSNITEKTDLGNSYENSTDKSIENGYYVSQYICRQEVEWAWKKRTGLSLEDYCEGKQGIENYRYYNVIYRYLNSLGKKKNAKSVLQLSQTDIQNIKKGYSNYVYAERFSIKKRLYQTFYEIECYSRTGDVQEMSLIQRLFWSKNAVNVIKQHLVIGCGTGDARNELVAPVIDSHPELCDTGCNPHNQFIYILVAFGLVGLVVMIFYVFYLPLKLHLFRNSYFVVFFIIAICWMFAESSFESYEGMTFISSLMSFFCLKDKK